MSNATANILRFITLFSVATVLVSVAAWFTHVVVCIQHHQWFLLIAGAIMFPVAVIHGAGIWFGWWG